jgi:hypothetical protein
MKLDLNGTNSQRAVRWVAVLTQGAGQHLKHTQHRRARRAGGQEVWTKLRRNGQGGANMLAAMGKEIVRLDSHNAPPPPCSPAHRQGQAGRNRRGDLAMRAKTPRYSPPQLISLRVGPAIVPASCMTYPWSSPSRRRGSKPSLTSVRKIDSQRDLGEGGEETCPKRPRAATTSKSGPSGPKKMPHRRASARLTARRWRRVPIRAILAGCDRHS